MFKKLLLCFGAGTAFITLLLVRKSEAGLLPKYPFNQCIKPISIKPSNNVLRWKDLAIKYGNLYNIEPSLILAIIHTESSGNPNNYRYEKHINDASRGLMQILYSTAKFMGYRGNPQGLYDPDTNIKYGARYLKNRIKKYGLYGGIAAYNSGTPKYDKYGCFINQYYVNKVLGAYIAYKRLVK